MNKEKMVYAKGWQSGYFLGWLFVYLDGLYNNDFITIGGALFVMLISWLGYRNVVTRMSKAMPKLSKVRGRY